MQILRELMYKPGNNFSGLNISKISNDHFSYHLKTLQNDGLVTKTDKGYRLTEKGKEFANTMDTDKLQIEKQPKVGVMIIARSNGKLLIQKRLKEPYYGFSGFLTGKVRFGETIYQTAARELEEESGLFAQFKLSYVLHEHVYSKAGDLLEDKIFFVTGASKVKGTLIDTKDGENRWIDENEFLKMTDKYYDEQDILGWFNNPAQPFIEKTYIIEQF